MQENIVIRSLTAADYEEAIDLLNLTFSMAKKPHDFQKALPRLCVRDDEHMRKHLAVVRDGKIRALLGVYPLPMSICGRSVMYSTVGNVATHPYETGKGYMSRLLDAAMKELARQNTDASRLGGLRQRYARYGYEPIGQVYSFTLTAHNVRAARAAENADAFAFQPIGAEDFDLLKACSTLQRRGLLYVERGEPDEFYRTLIAWESRPFAAFKDGRLIGYLVTDASGAAVHEAIGESDEAVLDMLCAWLKQAGVSSLSLSIESWRLGLLRRLTALCEASSIASPCRFLIRNWDRVIDALLALRHTLSPLPQGTVTLGIEGWGALELQADASSASARRTDREPCIWLSHTEASQLLAGTLSAACFDLPREESALLSAWLPLPLSWCTLDRV